MKLLFFSDVHGVPGTLERLLEHADALKPDLMVLLGDALYHGPRNGVPGWYDPQKVADLLNEHREHILAVRGNCDADVDQFLLKFPIMADFSEILTEMPGSSSRTDTFGTPRTSRPSRRARSSCTDTRTSRKSASSPKASHSSIPAPSRSRNAISRRLSASSTAKT